MAARRSPSEAARGAQASGLPVRRLSVASVTSFGSWVRRQRRGGDGGTEEEEEDEEDDGMTISTAATAGSNTRTISRDGERNTDERQVVQHELRRGAVPVPPPKDRLLLGSKQRRRTPPRVRPATNNEVTTSFTDLDELDHARLSSLSPIPSRFRLRSGLTMGQTTLQMRVQTLTEREGWKAQKVGEKERVSEEVEREREREKPRRKPRGVQGSGVY